MTQAESTLVNHFFDELEEELKSIVTKTPVHLTGKDLDGYLYFTLKPYVEELKIRQNFAERREEYEHALAIQRFINARLKEYDSEQ